MEKKFEFEISLDDPEEPALLGELTNIMLSTLKDEGALAGCKGDKISSPNGTLVCRDKDGEARITWSPKRLEMKVKEGVR